MRDNHIKSIENISLGLMNIQNDCRKEGDEIYMHLDSAIQALKNCLKAIRKEKKDEKITK